MIKTILIKQFRTNIFLVQMERNRKRILYHRADHSFKLEHSMYCLNRRTSDWNDWKERQDLQSPTTTISLCKQEQGKRRPKQVINTTRRRESFFGNFEWRHLWHLLVLQSKDFELTLNFVPLKRPASEPVALDSFPPSELESGSGSVLSSQTFASQRHVCRILYQSWTSHGVQNTSLVRSSCLTIEAKSSLESAQRREL